MLVHISNIDKDYINSAISKVSQLINIPFDVHIYFVNGNYSNLIQSLPINIKKDIMQLSNKISFSYSLKDKHYIFIQVKNRKYLLKNKKALIGLLLHEIFHTIQRKKGLDKKLKSSYKRFYLSKFSKLNKLDYDKRPLRDLFYVLGENSILLAKELYTNTEIIKKGLEDYLIEYYKEEFSNIKICPKPVFYDKFKKAAKKDMNIIRIAFEFEFALLSIILPLKKIRTKKARHLEKHIHSCFEINIEEISRKCREITFTYFENFHRKNFQKEFFEQVFFKIYNLLA